MMGLLVYREVIVPRFLSTPITRSMDRPQDVWLGVYVKGGERVGFINMRSIPEIREGSAGLKLGLTARMEMSLLGRVTSFSLTGSAWAAKETGLSEFDLRFFSGGHEMGIEGVIAEGTLDAQLHTAGETFPLRLPIGDQVLLSGGMGMPAMDVPLLKPGQEAYVDSFDPTTMSVGKARLACTGTETLTIDGEEVDTFVITTTIGGITTTAWVTEEEELVRAETPFGFSLEKITPEKAIAPVEPKETSSLIRAFSIRPTGVYPKQGATLLRLRFSGLAEDAMPPSDPVQSRTADGYVITVPEAPETGGPLGEGLDEYLASDAFVQSDHETIRAAAALAVGEEEAPWKQALKLHDWVFLNLEKEPVISVPSALDVLRTKEGDCNEHTVLFVAMARAAGIPSRIAIGVVWSEALEAFGYHAWPEVHVGRWIPMDPTFGQPLADATHIKLLNGGIDQWTRLLPYLGQMQIEVVEVR